MRPNEVKNMNTARLQQHLFLTCFPFTTPPLLHHHHLFLIFITAPSLLLWSPREGVPCSGEAPICGVSMHVLLHISAAWWRCDRFGGHGCYAEGWLCLETEEVRVNTAQLHVGEAAGKRSEVGWWESTKLAPGFSVCLCVCGQRGGQGEWVTATTRAYTHTHWWRHTLYFEARTSWACAVGPPRFYLQKIN